VTTDHTLAFGGWSGVSSQKFHTSVGTAFASLVRTFLVIVVGIAYVQILWRTLKARTSKVAVVDANEASRTRVQVRRNPDDSGIDRT